jgi:hypothetical protein
VNRPDSGRARRNATPVESDIAHRRFFSVPPCLCGNKSPRQNIRAKQSRAAQWWMPEPELIRC